MELSIIKKLVADKLPNHVSFIKECNLAEKYYTNDNDIMYTKTPSNINLCETENTNPLRNADNRIPHNYHGLLLNQKAAYMFTYPPTFDTGNEDLNSKILDVLGDDFPNTCLQLCVDAGNCGKAWLHFWKDDEDKFQYSPVIPQQVIPIYSGDLKKRLLAVLRIYEMTDEDGQSYDIYEYWDSETCTAYRKEKGQAADDSLTPYNMFVEIDLDTKEEEYTNVFEHDFEEVPFIEFPNNNIGTNDLKNIKPIIDIIDKVDSGYVNDLEDIQEVIFLLNNYGGQDLTQFLKGIKKYKTVDLEDSSGEGKAGLSTLTIDIPVEAREKLLERARRSLFELGQGVDPNPDNFGNSSGVALDYLYSLLELKAGFTETQFRLGFARLIRNIIKYLGNSVEDRIVQTWTRNKIRNDLETSQIAQNSMGILSGKTVRRNHPWTEDVELEEEQVEEEKKAMYDDRNPYPSEGDDVVE